MVPREVIEEIRNRVDIVRLIGEALPLKKVGRNYSGLCPFHREKTPSFTVSDQKQLFHCFGCGEGGTIFDFMMKFHHLTFPEVLERLAPFAGIDLAQYQKGGADIAARKAQEKKLLSIVQYARDVYHRALMESDAAKDAREYAKSRGITGELAKRLKLGFAPGSWDTLVQALQRDQKSLTDAVAAGLIGEKREGHYDLFRNRLLFPIENVRGETVGFGGRILGEGSPKYLNSPQTLLFNKGKMLYGLYDAQEAIAHEKKVIIVEGYMDRLALREAGLVYSVATLGTALTDDHAKLLRKFTDEVVVVFDGDAAGLRAARRSLRPLLSQGLRARVATLPEGMDPDTFIQQKGKKAFETLVAEASDLLLFFVEKFFKKESDVSRKAEAISELAALIASTSNVYLREAIVAETVRLTELDRAILQGEKRISPVRSMASIPVEKRIEASKLPKEELVLIRLSAERPEAREQLIRENLFQFFSNSKFVDAARHWIERITEQQEAGANVATFVGEWEDEATRSQLAAAFMEALPDESLAWQRVWNDCVKKIRQRQVKRLREAVENAERSGDSGTVEALQQQLLELKKLESTQGRIA